MKKTINTVYLEDDLSVFKALQGNRSVEKSRVKLIKSSIAKIGMIDAPIVCNEKMEVVDGQGRLEACKQLGIAVPYIVIHGIGISECRSMNINQKNWSTIDYIKSYADLGNDDYIRILDFYKNSGFGANLSQNILFPRGDTNKMREKLVDGEAVCSEKDLLEAYEMSAYLHRFDDIKTNRQKEFCLAIMRLVQNDIVDRFILDKKIHLKPREFDHISDILDCVGVIEDVYNFRVRERVYVLTEYLKYLESASKVMKAKMAKRGIE